jgi:hypothetical protein
MIPEKSPFFKKMKKYDPSPGPGYKKINFSDECPICKKKVTPADYAELEYVRTKRGTDIFIHTKCVSKWGQTDGSRKVKRSRAEG